METLPTLTISQDFTKRYLANTINYFGLAVKMKGLCWLYLSIFLVLVSTPSGMASVSCCTVCDCRPSAVWCERRGLTSLPVDIPVDTKRLYLFNNNILTIPEGSLSKLKNLQLLDLSSNKLTSNSIRPGILSGLTSLSDLNLSENRLTKIKKNTFSGIGSLVRLYLDDNRIDTIENNALKNLSNLVELKLNNNLLTTFPKIVACPNLQRLCLSHNRLERLQLGSLAEVNLEQLTLSHNRLLQLPSTTFRDTSNMRELDISNNRITRLPKCISDITSLQMLNLSGNSISSIPPNFLGNLRRMKSLDLQGLRLTTLPKGFIPRRVYLNVFDVSNNPWKCDCSMEWLPEYMRAVEIAIVREQEVQCNTPANLRGRQIATLYKENFACDSGQVEQPTNTNPRVPPPPVVPTRRKPTVDLCDGLSCANGATCFINPTNGRPACRCLSGWKGLLCIEPIHKPTRLPYTTTTSTRSPSGSDKQQLFIRQDTLTSHSVDIIFPTSKKKVTITVTEVVDEQTNRLTSTTTVLPGTHLYTVKDLQPGKKYNICISSEDVLHTSDTQSRKVVDKLCGEVKTTIITTNVPTNVMATSDGIVKYPDGGNGHVGSRASDNQNTKSDGKIYSNDDTAAVNDSAKDSQFLNTYEMVAIVAGLAAVVILILIVGVACFCRRSKKSKRANNNHVERGSKHGNGTTGATEMVPMMTQQLHYTTQPTAQLLAQNGDVYQTSQPSYQSCGQYPQRIGTPNKKNSLKRSNSSGSLNGAQPYLDIQRCSTTKSGQKYTTPVTDEQRTTATPNGCMYNGAVPYQCENGTILNNRGQELVFRHHGTPDLPSETCPGTGLRESDALTSIIPVRSTCTTVNQYYQEPISTTTISPQTVYQPMDNTLPITVNGYSQGHTVLPQHTPVQYTPTKQLRYHDARGPHLNGDPFRPVITPPHRLDNGIGHMQQDTVVM